MSTQQNRAGRRAKLPWSVFMLVAVGVLGAPLLAHHSFASYYVEQDTIEVEGDVVSFEYKNPHAWLYIVGEEPFGRRKAYAAEWSSRTQLDRDGITKQTLRAGDSVRIWASPNRDPNDSRIRLKRIERRSDGFKWGQQNRRDAR
jgi:hypothetical protein